MRVHTAMTMTMAGGNRPETEPIRAPKKGQSDGLGSVEERHAVNDGEETEGVSALLREACVDVEP